MGVSQHHLLLRNDLELLCVNPEPEVKDRNIRSHCKKLMKYGTQMILGEEREQIITPI